MLKNTHISREKVLHVVGTISSSFGSRLLNFVIFGFIARSLDSGESDIFFYYYNIAVLLSVVTDFGMRNTLYLDIAKCKSDLSDAANTLISAQKAKLKLIVIFISGAAVFGYFVGISINATDILLYCIIVILFPVSDLSCQALRGMRLAFDEFVILNSEKIALVILLFAMGGWFSVNLTSVLMAFVLTSVLRFVFSSLQVFKRLNIRINGIISELKSIKSYDLDVPSGLVVLLDSFYLKLSIFLFAYAGQMEIMTKLSLFLMIVHSSLMIPSIVTNAMFPYIFNSKLVDKKMVRIYFMVVFLLSILYMAMLMMFSDLITKLVLDVDYLSNELMYMCLSIPAISLSQAIRFFSIANNKSKGLFVFIVIAILLMLIFFVAVQSYAEGIFFPFVYIVMEFIMFFSLIAFSRFKYAVS